MKYALKKWYNYLIGFGIYCIVALAAILPRIILIKYDAHYNFPAKWISYVFFFGGVVLALLGFIIQDLYRGYVRHKINDWDNNLEEKYINKAWMIYLPFITSTVLSFISGIVFSFKFLWF